MVFKKKDTDNKEFYIVDKRILPKSIQNVIKVNDLILKTKISKYSAIKKVGISRSTYYKYKDFISPSTPAGIMALIKGYNIDLEGKDVVVVGRSNIVGKPVAALVLNNHGTVTICNSHTKNLADKTKNEMCIRDR